jgi:cytochrome c oxidase cbb3-type subunit IV
MEVNLLRTIGEVTSFLMFIGILVWALSGARNKGFNEAAQLPFDDDEDVDKTKD